MSDGQRTSALIDRFLGSFNSGDLGAMRPALADDAIAFITGPDGNPVQLTGADMYTAALEAMDLANVDYSVALTQAPMMISEDQALIMTEVRARRGDKALQNFAAHLLRLAGGKIVEMYMVDAKPAESDEFWASSPRRRVLPALAQRQSSRPDGRRPPVRSSRRPVGKCHRLALKDASCTPRRHGGVEHVIDGCASRRLAADLIEREPGTLKGKPALRHPRPALLRRRRWGAEKDCERDFRMHLVDRTMGLPDPPFNLEHLGCERVGLLTDTAARQPSRDGGGLGVSGGFQCGTNGGEEHRASPCAEKQAGSIVSRSAAGLGETDRDVDRNDAGVWDERLDRSDSGEELSIENAGVVNGDRYPAGLARVNTDCDHHGGSLAPIPVFSSPSRPLVGVHARTRSGVSRPR